MRTLALFVGMCLAFLLSLVAGKVWIGPADWLSDTANGLIFSELRLPRAVLGAMIGAALGVSGAALQGFLRNPLADPTVVGVSSSAALGGVLAIFAGIGGVAMFSGAMIAAISAMLLLVLMAGRNSGPLGFILAGVVLSTLAGSLTAFVISIAPNPYASGEIIAWLMGALTDRGMDDVIRGVPFMLAGTALLVTTGRSLDALTLGEDSARSLGVDLRRLQWTVILGVGLCVGSAVAVSGVVGFVGLIVPHLVRAFTGSRPSSTLVPSALSGAMLVLAADSLVRLVPGNSELRLGIAMSALGAPFFFLLLSRIRNRTT